MTIMVRMRAVVVVGTIRVGEGWVQWSECEWVRERVCECTCEDECEDECE